MALVSSPKVNGKILIVDDISSNTEFLTHLLTWQGYEIQCASSGADALDLASRFQPDLILLDVKMPKMDGYEVCQRLKADERTEKIPVIFVSALDRAFDKVKAFRVGAVDYITKPFQLEEMVARVEHQLKLVRLQTQLLQQQNQIQAQNEQLRQEIQERQKAEQSLFQEKELAQITLQSIGDGVITTDARGHITHFNLVAERLTGWKNQEVKGKLLTEVFQIVHEQTRQPLENPVTQVLREGRTVGSISYAVLVARDGAEHPIEDSAAPIRDRNGQLIGSVMVFSDDTQSRQRSRQLSWQATHDALTGVLNRRAFEQQLAEAISSAKRRRTQHALCYLDLDQFKQVNDSCGHAAGDELLRQITLFLQKQIRIADVLARLGGDEFSILFYHCPLPKAKQLAESLREGIQTLRFTWQGKTFTVGASIGLVAVEETSQDVASVLNAADAACYAAKTQGRNCVQIYQTTDQQRQQWQGGQQWLSRLEQALADNRFCLYAQKIVPVAEEEKSHSEILLRLVDEQDSLIPPMAFIPAAERYGLMLSLDRWVIQALLAHSSNRGRRSLASPGFESRGTSDKSVTASSSVSQCQPIYAINLSEASLNDDRFLDFLKQQLHQYSKSPQMFCWEIAETTATANFSRVVCLVEELKKLGCYVAIDDFGSSISSFSYLKQLPVDFIKIDGHLIKQIVIDAVDLEIVQCINRICHVMNIKTIAKFVEDQSILARLQTIGINYVQGYGVAKPQPLIEIGE